VARLISRLRTMPNVTRVALGSSAKSNSQSSSTTPDGSATGCKPSTPSFNVVVFYAPVTGAGAGGATGMGTTSTTTSPGTAK
jgi:hypothetical protein